MGLHRELGHSRSKYHWKQVVGWAEPVINVFLQYILWGLVSYGLPMPLYAKLTPQNDSQVYIWPSVKTMVLPSYGTMGLSP
jgi:hypothetical protein